MNKMAMILASTFVLASCGEPVDGEPDTETVSIDDTPSNDLQRADLVNGEGASIGYVEFKDDGGTVSLMLEATGLDEGMHAVHLHETGQCEGPDFQSAGVHWNPTGNEHGRDNPQGAHMGDLANMSVGADGAGRSDFLVNEASVADGQYSLADNDGTALVIHEGPDDYRTDPSGDAGSRVACAVIAPAGGGAN